MEEVFLNVVDKITRWLTIAYPIGFCHIVLRFAEAWEKGLIG